MDIKNNKILSNKWVRIFGGIILYFILFGAMTRVTGWITILGAIGLGAYLFIKSEKFKQKSKAIKSFAVVGLLFVTLIGGVMTTMTPESLEQNRLASEKAKIEKNEKQAAEQKAKEEQATKDTEKKAEEEKAKKDAEDKAKEEQAKKDAEDKAKEEQAKKDAEDKAKDEQAKKDAEDKAKAEEAKQATASAGTSTSINSNPNSSNNGNSGSTVTSTSGSNQTTAPQTPTAPPTQQTGGTVYWLTTGTSNSYHKDPNCQYIRGKKTASGSVQDAINTKHTDPCNKCVH